MNTKFLRVVVAVADLRREPVDRCCGYAYDPIQQSQLVYNEFLEYHDENEEWYSVRATEQSKMKGSCWSGYPGWVRKSAVAPVSTAPVLNAVVKRVNAVVKAEPGQNGRYLAWLPLGAKLEIDKTDIRDSHAGIRVNEDSKGWINLDQVNMYPVITDADHLRKNLAQTAQLFIGTPYLWGGRSSVTQGLSTENSELRTLNSELSVTRGVDCSGFTNLVYRANLIDIPRDAADQKRVCASVNPRMLDPADLIFVSAENRPEQIAHVMFSIGNEEFIEAVETGDFVRVNSFREKYGFSLRELEERQFIINGKQIHFGSILGNGGKN